MNELIEIIKGIYELIMITTIIVIIIIAVIKSSESKTAQKLETKVKQEQEEKTTQPIIQKPAFCAYQRKKILTKNEYYFYTKLKEVTNKYNLQILTKIRLADLIEVKTYFNKIKAKHIDFAIVDDMKVLLIIELDDQSHNNIERIERDKFVDDNLTACGYKIVHTRGAIDAIEKELQTVTRNASVPPRKCNDVSNPY